MNYVLDELQKSMKYHLRQLEENLRKIQLSEESIESLKKHNEEHRKAISEINDFIESVKQD